MQARGLLMIEHRLIERMIALVEGALARIESAGEVDPALVDTAVDFIRTYADRTHHGKEEDILFRDLAERDLSAGDRRLMRELIAEHVHGRETTAALVAANDRYRKGDAAALADVAAALRALVAFYPQHIAKEDEVFFPAARGYLTDEEDQAMLAEFRRFDAGMIHDKYRSLVEGLEGD